jgi:hypothetical protein
MKQTKDNLKYQISEPENLVLFQLTRIIKQYVFSKNRLKPIFILRKNAQNLK